MLTAAEKKAARAKAENTVDDLYYSPVTTQTYSESELKGALDDGSLGQDAVLVHFQKVGAVVVSLVRPEPKLEITFL